MAAVGGSLPFHATPISSCSSTGDHCMAHLPPSASQSHGSSSSASFLDDAHNNEAAPPATTMPVQPGSVFDIISVYLLSDDDQVPPPSSAVVSSAPAHGAASPVINVSETMAADAALINQQMSSDHSMSDLIDQNARGGGDVQFGAMRREENSRIAFRMRSEVEVLDDGFKWRKYGKKSVKNSPNPRNYFRCSTEGCTVKKRVERDREDRSYVITTYEGIHNHVSPGVVYYASQDTVSGRFYVSGCQIPPPQQPPPPPPSGS